MHHCVQLASRAFTTHSAILALAISMWVLPAATARGGGINGFDNGVGWTGNSNGTGGPAFTASTLTLTDGGLLEARSAFYNTAQPIGVFSVQFTYQASMPGGEGLADGATFTLQTQGLSALGSTGSGLGAGGITPSAEVEFNIYNGHTIGTNFATNGATSSFNSTSPVDVSSGDPILVSLTYNGSTLSETLTDLSTKATFNTSYSTNLASVLGSGNAYVGFTGGTGEGSSVQVISNFVFQNSVPEPSGLVLLGIASIALGAFEFNRRRRAVKPGSRANAL
jgi:hypothetical protein